MTHPSTGYVSGAPKVFLRVESLFVLIVATVIYARLDAGWWLFGILFLVPDLSMAGYLLGRQIGAAIYNTAHSYTLPLALIGFGVVYAVSHAIAIGLIWAGHIGFDRALGYGLKYTTGFGSSHLGPIGRARETRLN